jgi:Cellulase (glycosyl hydrolase family 5)
MTRRDIRPAARVYRLVTGLTVVLLMLMDFGAPTLTAAAVSTAGRSGVQGQSFRPDPAPPLPYTTSLPLVMRQQIPANNVFGVQMYGKLNSPSAELGLAQAAGVSWARWPFMWKSIEPDNTTPNNYYWATTDAVFTAAKAAGLNIIATVWGNPTWAATYQSGPIDRTDIGQFAEFIAAVVERYDGDGQNDAPGSPVVNYFELYNEPDGGDPVRALYGHGYWGHFGADYAEMLCAVYPAAKAASPNAKIVLGGIAHEWFTEDGGPFVKTFVDDVLAAGGGDCLDALAFHYYPPYELVWKDWGPGLSGKANYLRDKLNSHGLNNLPLLVTEAGLHSNADPRWPSSPEMQAGYVIKLFTQTIASHIPTMIWFCWTDLPDYWAANGLLDLNRQPKLAYDAFKVARGKLGPAAFQRRLSDSETGSSDVEAYLFHSTLGPLYVTWVNLKDTTRQVRLPGKTARVGGLVDETLFTLLDADDGIADGFITVTAGFRPIYVNVTP